MEVEDCEIAGSSAKRYVLSNGAALIHAAGYLTRTEADALRDACKQLPWEHKPIRGIPTRRANAWLADDPRAVYRYTGQVWTPHPLPEPLRKLGAKLAGVLGEELNCALATFYADGQATVGWHADAEPIFGKNPTVVSVSLGATRVFQIVHRSRARGPSTRPDLSLPLEDGALVVMRGTFQHEYLHALKTAAPSTDSRYNLSFRRHVGAPQAPC